MKRYVVLVAGGSGSRMKSGIPKQFLKFSGKPIVQHTIERFYNFDNSIQIILVLPESSLNTWNEMASNLPCQVRLVTGGATRSDSTRAGLELVPSDCIVAIHDAVRPFPGNELLSRCFETAEKYGNACPAIVPGDSLRMKNGNDTASVDRNLYYLVQTPQCFQSNLLKDAFDKCNDSNYTDEASLFESAGHKIYLVEGNRWNIKITFPDDLKIAEQLVSWPM